MITEADLSSVFAEIDKSGDGKVRRHRAGGGGGGGGAAAGAVHAGDMDCAAARPRCS